MSEHKSGPREAVEGIVEDAKGKIKEAAGAVTGDDDLRGEGRAQQDKAESQRDAARKEAEAEKERGEAAAHEARQRAHQLDR
ncbi:microaggregate-binding protein 1 [Nocardia sp. CA-119907]|uniref:microaggregate-binding protein 1 n=1 Tax=Nocardia sp. CA-119907 TaxID=3239973 RepID=UPI003D99AE2A